MPVHPGGAPGVGDQQQREQPPHLTLVGHQLAQHAGQVQRPVHEVHPEQRRSRRRRVPEGEQQVDHAEDRVQPGGQLRRAGHPVGDPGGGDLLLRPGQAGGHRGLGHQEGPGDVAGRDAAHQPQGEGHLRLPGQCRVTAHEDQPQPVVRNGVLRLVCEFVVHRGLLHRRRPARWLLGWHQQRQPRAQCPIPPQGVDRPAPGRRGQPAGRVARDPVAGPGDQRRGVRLLDALLGQVEVAGDAHRRGEHLGPPVTVRVGDRRLDLRRSGHHLAGGVTDPPMTGRTSTPPPCRTAGFRPAISRAVSRSGASIT